ncbi:hypothetical protein [Sulfurimonas marina]|uniref:Diguanylate cyclase n=1 Tax=Sulfurimonas marina TaxID=2590551 RepID=A0A7M1AXG4_9BACT|nr:hypothetical protein [Sulfurimonas marina]QOP41062.1 hypothetical protein FJR03_04625 [Sulfurimonas marina]
MSDSVDKNLFEDTPLKIIESLIDIQKDLVFIYHDNEPVLFNKASRNFFGLETLEQFAREYGKLENRFMPHDFYFHAGKIEEQQSWLEAIESTDETDRIISMLNHKIKPHAFSVTIERPVDGYELVFFHDITTDLIKRIMTENNTNLDTDTHAYNRNYFEHISPRLISAATFNEKLIGICLIELENDEKDFIESVAATIKCNIRHDDMLVRWSKNSFLLVFLVASEEHANLVGRKIVDTLCHCQPTQTIRTAMSLQRTEDTVSTIIQRCENRLGETNDTFSIV